MTNVAQDSLHKSRPLRMLDHVFRGIIWVVDEWSGLNKANSDRSSQKSRPSHH
jgi:hypothetical protein